MTGPTALLGGVALASAGALVVLRRRENAAQLEAERAACAELPDELRAPFAYLLRRMPTVSERDELLRIAQALETAKFQRAANVLRRRCKD